MLALFILLAMPTQLVVPDPEPISLQDFIALVKPMFVADNPQTDLAKCRAESTEVDLAIIERIYPAQLSGPERADLFHKVGEQQAVITEECQRSVILKRLERIEALVEKLLDSH